MIRSLDVSKIIQPCSEHPEREITVYCKDCCVTCCITCVEEKHDRHSIIAIEKKYMEREDELNELLSNIEKSTLTNLRSNIDELGEKLNLQQTEFEAVKQEVEKFRKDLKSTVDKECDNLLDEVEQKEVELRSGVESIIKEMENKIKANENFISACSARIREGGLGLIGYNPGVPPSHEQSVPHIQIQKQEFVPRRDLVEMITHNVGKIKMTRTDSGGVKGIATEESVSVDVRGKSNDTHTNEAKLEEGASGPSVTPRDEESNMMSRGELSSFSAQVFGSFQTKIKCRIIAVVGKGAAWVGDWNNNTIYLYDDKGKIMNSIDVASGVWGLGVKRSGDVVVSNQDKRMRLVTGSVKVSTLIVTSPFTPQGVCLTDREEIVVCMAGQGDKNHVAVYSPDGKSKVREITVKDKQGRQMLPDHVCVVMNGEDFSVLNYYSNILTFDESGKVRWVYDGSQVEQKGHFAPRGLCVDKFCNLLVSDCGRHYVHYVDREGVLIQLLTKEQHGIECPCGIGIDNRTGQVWLGNDSRKVWVVKYLHT